MANYRRIFLDGYSYFITVVTHGRKPILIEHIDLLRESFRESKRYYSYSIGAISVMPDHFHMIITPHNAKDYPKIIKSIKYNFTKRYQSEDDVLQSFSRYKRKMQPIWQKRYYEHTIRDQNDWDKKIDYIKNNPIKHGLAEVWSDWKYSSFGL
ncbi:MAG: transposase [Sulfurovaceae bacterium]|nr:transposase [Sulfurovaceae bacterium]